MDTKEEAKKIFNKHYLNQLDKNIYPHHKAVELSLEEANKNILDYNCLCQWKMDFLVEIRDIIKKMYV